MFINFCSGDNHGYAQRHEFKYFGAEGLSSEWIVFLRDNTQIGIGHYFGYFFAGHSLFQKNSILQMKFIDKFGQIISFRSATVNMKFSLWRLVFYFCKSFNGDIQSLMPTKCSGVHHDKFVIVSGSWPLIKNGLIGIIHYGGAFSFISVSYTHLTLPTK